MLSTKSVYKLLIYLICIYKWDLRLTFLNESKLSFLHPVKWFPVLRCITNKFIKHQSFVYTQLNDLTVLFLTIQLNISHLFALRLDAQQLYLTHRYDPIRYYYSGSGWTWCQWLWRGTPHFPKLNGWSLTIRLFSDLCRTHVERDLTPRQRYCRCIQQSQPTEQLHFVIWYSINLTVC